MARIFISYSRADERDLEKFSQLITSLYPDHTFWYDAHITGGQDWWDSILKEIAQCDIFVYLISNDSLTSEYCQQEVREALRLQKQILPLIVRRSDVNLAPQDIREKIRRLQWVDLQKGLNFQTHQKLIDTFNYLLNEVSYLPIEPLSPHPMVLPNMSEKKSLTVRYKFMGYIEQIIIGLIITVVGGLILNNMFSHPEGNMLQTTIEFSTPTNDTVILIDESSALTLTNTLIPTTTEMPIETPINTPTNDEIIFVVTNSPTLTLREHHDLGFQYYLEREYDKALSHYNEAIRINPRYADIYYSRGLVHQVLNNYDEAIEDYNQAINIDSHYARAYNNRGYIQHILGRYEQAISDYNEALRIEPQDSRFYNNRGNTYRRLERYDEAIRDYDNAILLNPNYTIAYNNRGYSYHLKGQCEPALADLQRALEIDPDHELAQSNFNYVLFICQ